MLRKKQNPTYKTSDFLTAYSFLGRKGAQLSRKVSL